MSRKKSMKVSERVMLILGDDATVYPDALDSWARCLQEAMTRLEKVFTEEEWQYLGQVAVKNHLTSNLSSVPFGVVLVHYLLDQQTLTLEPNQLSKIEKIVAKLKKFESLQSSALCHTLESYVQNSEQLYKDKWWITSERIGMLKGRGSAKRAA